jgi:16S rRNA (guanine966-N2)-methyltransferase
MLRLTGGEFRGRLIESPGSERVRPTQARMRQALFNSLQSKIRDANVLDLFAGSGALGFEALSRGAEKVVFVEQDRSALKLIAKNAATLGVQDRIKIISESVDRAWSRVLLCAPFDIVLADPPYAAGWEERLLLEAPWSELLATGGCFCLEWGTRKSQVKKLSDRVHFLVKRRERIYGESVLTTYQADDGVDADGVDQ